MITMVPLLFALFTATQPFEAASAAPAAELRRAMAARGLEAVATEDEADPGRFIAALAVPGQLLVVTARCDAVDYLRGELARERYRSLYDALHACALAPTKFFVHDMGGDGLRPNLSRDATPDSVYEVASRQILLDGNWRQHELPRDAYLGLWKKLDARYDRMLNGLIRRLEP